MRVERYVIGAVITLLITAAGTLAIPVLARADPGPPPPGVHNLSEQKFLADIATEGMRPAPPGPAGESNALSEGYVICGDLRGGYSRAWVTANAATLPGLSNLGAGSLPPHLRQLLVNTAWVDLCPEVPAKG
jgi:hypothetical protein